MNGRPTDPIVPPDFVVPLELVTANTVLRPLGPEHNEADLQAWTSSIDHIRATPGFGPDHGWPPPDGMPPAENLSDLTQHQQDFEDRSGFTYTVLDPETGAVVGCVYIYGDPDADQSDGDHPDGQGAEVRSWVIAERPELDREVWTAVSDWLETSWPFRSVRYADRGA